MSIVWKTVSLYLLPPGYVPPRSGCSSLSNASVSGLHFALCVRSQHLNQRVDHLPDRAHEQHGWKSDTKQHGKTFTWIMMMMMDVDTYSNANPDVNKDGRSRVKS